MTSMSMTDWENRSLSEIAEGSASFNEMLYEACNGNLRAQYALGMWYETYKREPDNAKTWYKKAAGQGHEGACEALKELDF